MTIIKNHLPFSLKETPITVEFLILHYTAASLKDTLNLFQKTKLFSHFVIDFNGSIYEFSPCLTTPPLCRKARHAGVSHWKENEKTWTNFNNFSIGIELVNWNGNLLKYSPRQYEALSYLVCEIKSLYPAMENPDRVLGHEHIAGDRGKVDPGHQFHWHRFFSMTYPDINKDDYPKRTALLDSTTLEAFKQKMPSPGDSWMAFNLNMEQRKPPP